MTGASIEATLELWASSLRDVKARMRPLFTQERVAVSAQRFVDGLLGEERRKTGWMRAEAAGDPHKANEKNAPAFFAKTLYKARARIEQGFGRLKRFKRVALRCEKTAQNFRSIVSFAAGLCLIKFVHTA